MRRSTLWILIVSALNTYLAYACLEDIGFYARQDLGAMLGFPGVIGCMILSGNVHAAYPELLFPPVNFALDVVILIGLRKLFERIRQRV